MQLQSALKHLAELEDDKQSYLAPYLTHFEKLCQTMLVQVSALTFPAHTSLDQGQNPKDNQ